MRISSMPPRDLEFERFTLIAGGHGVFQLMWAGVKLGVYSLLSKSPGLTKAEIAREIGVEIYPATILLRGLTALRLIQKDGDHYSINPSIRKKILRGTPDSLIEWVIFQAYFVYPGIVDLVEALKLNTNVGLRNFPGRENNLYERLAHDPKLEKIFHDGIGALSRSSNALLGTLEDLREVKHFIDIGGSYGSNAITLANAFPDMRLTVFDLPLVCQRAARNIADQGLSSRIKTHPGNLLTDPFPRDGDCMMFAHMLSIWSPERDISLLKKAYDALPPGGRVVIFGMMGNDEETGPMSTAMASPYFLTIATGEGMLYSGKQFSEFLSAAGFQTTRRIALPFDHTVLIGTKPK